MLASAHLPIVVIEGIISAFCVGFLHKVLPEILPPAQQGTDWKMP
jgi:cobalt/nickel transport system permease protein